MQWDFGGKVVVVTGAARGIGKGIADAFSEAGATVVIVDRDVPAGLEDEASMYRCDIVDRAQVDATVAAIHARHGHIDVLVNNAGINVEGRIEELTDEAWARCFDVNVAGTFRVCRAVIPIMKSQKSGRIVNAASFAAIIPSINGAAYAASKAAVAQFTRVLAGELGPWNITANAYAPGMVPTGMNGFADLSQAAQDRLLDTLSLRRWESPANVAGAVMFLASDAAEYVTGTLLDVSGGKFATQIPGRAYDGLGSA
jgi:3-oxoacyl-[acyl-carrier protein] reductase